MVTQVKIYNGSTWVDYDLSVDVSRVFLSQDLKLTENFGKYKVDSKNPNVTVPANGKSWLAVLLDAYSTDIQPTKTNPSVSAFNLTGNGSSQTEFEIGTTVLPQWTSTFNAGSYAYKASESSTNIVPVSGTGVSATGWTIRVGTSGDTIGTTKDGTAPDNFKIIIGNGNTTDLTGSATYSATATYGNGRYALTKFDTLYDPLVRITQGSTSAKTDTLTWYRAMFGGGTSDLNINSAVIRGRGSAAKAKVRDSKDPFVFSATKGHKQVIFAYPESLTTKEPKFEIFTMAWGATEGFVKSTVEVADNRGGSYGLMNYTVWSYTPAGAYTADETKYRAYF